MNISKELDLAIEVTEALSETKFKGVLSIDDIDDIILKFTLLTY